MLIFIQVHQSVYNIGIIQIGDFLMLIFLQVHQSVYNIGIKRIGDFLLYN